MFGKLRCSTTDLACHAASSSRQIYLRMPHIRTCTSEIRMFIHHPYLGGGPMDTCSIHFRSIRCHRLSAIVMQTLLEVSDMLEIRRYDAVECTFSGLNSADSFTPSTSRGSTTPKHPNDTAYTPHRSTVSYTIPIHDVALPRTAPQRVPVSAPCPAQP